MIHSARSVANTIFISKLFSFAKFWKVWKDDMCEYSEIMITTGRDCRSALWINLIFYLAYRSWPTCHEFGSGIGIVKYLWTSISVGHMGTFLKEKIEICLKYNINKT